RDVALGRDVDLKAIAQATEGMSGADLKRLRDAAGMKALSRAAGRGKKVPKRVAVSMVDIRLALDLQRNSATLVQV
ncbi:MAG: hypothetical protein ACRD1T_04660, partial [Acidimicrobiia bacterium]